MEVDASTSHRSRNPCRAPSETAEHHDSYEKTHAEHRWSDWYAPYLRARENGSPEEAATAAARYMEDVLRPLPDDGVRLAALSEYVDQVVER